MLIFWLILSWLMVGVLAAAAGFLGFLYPIAALGLLFPLASLIVLIRALIFEHGSPAASKFEKTILLALAVIGISHAVQLFTPETGFDAVWYHLPVAAADARAHRFVYLPDLYQSANPLFSDGIFFLGYMVAGEMGAKLVGFLFGLTTVILAYALSRMVLPRRWALLVALSISTFQVVAWQSASFYVDVAKAAWELMALWSLVFALTKADQLDQVFLTEDRVFVLSALTLGASLATKQFSLLLLPVFAALWWIASREQALLARVLRLLKLLCISLVVAAPFWLFALKHTGSPLFGIQTHVTNLQPIGGQSDLVAYVLTRAAWLVRSPFDLLLARDYVSPLLVLLLPLLIWGVRTARFNATSAQLLGVFAAAQWLVWWFVPPLSTRYALSGFVALFILLLWLLQQFVTERKYDDQKTVWAVAVVAVCLFVPRLLVNVRSLRYLTGQQNKARYLQQFEDGLIDEPLYRWHGRQLE